MLTLSCITQTSYLFRYVKFLKLDRLNQKLNQIINITYWKPLNTVYDSLKNIKGSGDFLFLISKTFVHFCIFLGNKAIPLLCYTCYLIPKILILFMLTFTIFFTKINTIYFYIFMSLIFIFVRFINLFIYILNDFSLQNRKIIEPYLIIDKKKTTIKYELNLLKVKNPTKEKLNLYVERYSTFSSTEIFTSSFNYYKTYIIDAKIMPYTFSIFFICLLKLLMISLQIKITNIYFLFLFLLVLILETFNKKKTKTNDNIPK